MNFATALKHRLTAVITVMLALSLLVGPAITPAYGAGSELSQKRSELNSVKSRLNQTRQKIKEAKAQESQLVAQIETTDGRITVVQKEYDRLDVELKKVSQQRGLTENQLAALQAELHNTQQELERTRAKLVEQKDLLDNRLKNIYKRGNSTYIEFVLSSSDFLSLLNRLRLLEFIVQQDLDIIKRIDDARQQIEIKKAEVERDSAAVNSQRMALLNQERYIKSLTDKQLIQKQALEGEINNKQTLLGQIKNNRAAYELAEDQLLEESNSLVSRIRNLERSLRGRVKRVGSSGMVWPTDGPLTSSFGMRKHPILGYNRMHTGIDIGAPYGQSIVAADAGVVIEAASLKGYGQTVIIVHGDGISTLYAHMSAILVSEGQSVSRGQTIGRIGSTGLSTGPHLHFEVRRDGEPQNPMSWY